MSKNKKFDLRTHLIDTVLGMLYSHREQHDKIFDDYLEGDSKMLDAIMVEDKAFTAKIEALREDVSDNEESFEINVGVDIITEHLKELLMDDDQLSELFKIILNQGEEIVFNYLSDKGYAFVKLNSLADKMKLEDFITTEIYPHYNDRNNFSI
ncbi:hypothetical protein [Pedobacter sp.]